MFRHPLARRPLARRCRVAAPAFASPSAPLPASGSSPASADTSGPAAGGRLVGVPLRRALIGVALLGAAVSMSPGVARAQPAAPAATPSPASGDLTRFTSGIVRLDARVPDDATSAPSLGARRSGSGVVLGPQLVLTIGYLLLEAEQVTVTTASGKRLPAAVAGYDHATGFGLVRTVLPMDGTAIELGDSDLVKEKQTLLTQGQGEAEATELVVLSRKAFSGGWEYLLERPIYTFPPVNNWSGSALITQDGKLVGIGSLVVNDAASERKGVPGNLFVPVNLLKPILSDLVARGRRGEPVQPWLGLTTEMVRGALTVVRVARDGPAEAAGVEPGDVVLGVGAETVGDQADFYRRVWRLGPAGTDVPLRLKRGGAERAVSVRSVDRMETLRTPRGI